MAAHFGQKARGQAGRQHELDAEYFDRIEAMNFALAHDDGQSSRTYNDADVILIGVSRSSKTPTCIYLANRGIKCANVPIVPNCPLPPELFLVKKPLVVGLTKDASPLVQIRRNRLQMIARDEDTDYVDLSVVREEVATARRLCSDHGWPSHRRHPPLDRGDRRHHHPDAARPPRRQHPQRRKRTANKVVRRRTLILIASPPVTAALSRGPRHPLGAKPVHGPRIAPLRGCRGDGRRGRWRRCAHA